MTKGRLEAFSDGVIAILITIMVLELQVPHGADLDGAAAARRRCSSAYVLSFVYLGIYWNNHHHMLHAVERVNGAVLWANLHLLFWLSLVPFVTGVDGREPVRAACRRRSTASCCSLAAVAYYDPAVRAAAQHGPRRASPRRSAATSRARRSPYLYCLAIVLSLVRPWMGVVVYVAVALMWLVPDRRVERRMTATEIDSP